MDEAADQAHLSGTATATRVAESGWCLQGVEEEGWAKTGVGAVSAAAPACQPRGLIGPTEDHYCYLNAPRPSTTRMRMAEGGEEGSRWVGRSAAPGDSINPSFPVRARVAFATPAGRLSLLAPIAPTRSLVSYPLLFASPQAKHPLRSSCVVLSRIGTDLTWPEVGRAGGRPIERARPSWPSLRRAMLTLRLGPLLLPFLRPLALFFAHRQCVRSSPFTCESLHLLAGLPRGVVLGCHNREGSRAFRASALHWRGDRFPFTPG